MGSRSKYLAIENCTRGEGTRPLRSISLIVLPLTPISYPRALGDNPAFIRSSVRRRFGARRRGWIRMSGPPERRMPVVGASMFLIVRIFLAQCLVICQGSVLFPGLRKNNASVEPEVSRRVEAARVYAGVKNQKVFARTLGWSLDTYRRRVDGTYPWHEKDLLLVADKTGVPSWFLTRGWDAAPATSRAEADALTDQAVEEAADLIEPSGQGAPGRRAARRARHR